MLAKPSTPLQALLRCALGAALLIGIIAGAWVGVPWHSVFHALDVAGGAFGHFLVLVFTPVGHGLLWVLGHLFNLIAVAISWPLREPISFLAVEGIFFLTSSCLLFKLLQDSLGMAKDSYDRWLIRTALAWVLSSVYGVFSFGAYMAGSLDNSTDHYASVPTLGHQLHEMEEAKGAEDFSEQVQQANTELAQYGYTDRRMDEWVSAPDRPVVLVDAHTRVAAFQGTLNFRSCRDLGRPTSAFTAQIVNGVPIHSSADLERACHYILDNEVTVWNKPNRWLAPAP